MVVDWTGTNPQVKGAINNTLSFTKAASYTGVRSVLPPGIPNNEGVFRAIEVICPPGTVGNGVLPAACAARGLTGFRMVDCMFGALAMMLPDKVKAAGDGGNTGISIGGYDAERKPFVYVDFTCGAWGARPWADGLDGNSHMFANMASHSIEVTEAEHPIQLTRLRVRRRQGGRRQISAAACRSGATTGSSRRKACCRCAPTGAIIGRSASTAAARAGRRRTTSTRDAENRLLPSKLTMTIKRGDVFRHVLAGAGGWGDPLERDPAAVLRDVRNELLSPEKAAGRLRRRDRSRALDGRCGRDGQAARARSRRRAAGRDRPEGPVARSDACHAARRNSAMTDHLSRRCRHRRHLHRHRAARLRRRHPHQEDLLERRATTPRRSSTASPRCSPKPGWRAARSRRSATAPRSPPTPSSSTRARGSA